MFRFSLADLPASLILHHTITKRPTHMIPTGIPSPTHMIPTVIPSPTHMILTGIPSLLT